MYLLRKPKASGKGVSFLTGVADRAGVGGVRAVAAETVWVLEVLPADAAVETRLAVTHHHAVPLDPLG